MIPIRNLVSNRKIYYSKLADELIRYTKIRDYILMPNNYLNLQKIHYKINDNEVLLLENQIFSDYLRKLTILKNSSYYNLNLSTETTKPRDKVIYNKNYSNKYLINKQMSVNNYEEENERKEKQNKLENSSIKNLQKFSIRQRDATDDIENCLVIDYNKELSFDNFNDVFNGVNLDRFNIIEFKSQFDCTYKLIIYMNKIANKKKVKKDTLQNMLVENYVDNLDVNQIRTVENLLLMSGKDKLHNEFKEVDIDIDIFIKKDHFYLTEYEILLLSYQLNIGIIIISNSLAGILNKKYFLMV